MSSHTPAPWSFDGSVAIHHGDPTTPHTLVALVYSCKGGTLPANARLIAAAPELLGLLQVTADRLEQVLRFSSVGEPEEFINRKIAAHPELSAARAAIAKATGA